MNALHFQEGFINERLEVFLLDTVVLSFTWGLSIWFSGYCRSSARHRRTLLSEGQLSVPTNTSLLLGCSNQMWFGSIQAKS